LTSALVNLRKWQVEPRVWLVFTIIFVYAVYLYANVLQFAAEYQKTVPIWAVFGYFSTSFMRLIFGLLMGILFCSAPFYERHSPFLVARSGRLNWILGQILYVIVASFLLAVAVYISVFISILPRISFPGDWGIVIRTISENPGAVNVSVYFPPGIDRFSPLLANLAAFGMIWFVGVFTGMFFLCFNQIFRRVVTFSVYGLLLFQILSADFFGTFNWGYAVRYASPLSFVTLSYFREFNSEGVFPPILYGVFFLGSAILLLGALTIWRFCRKDLVLEGNA
jgi:hypothetical protein